MTKFGSAKNRLAETAFVAVLFLANAAYVASLLVEGAVA